MRASTSLDLTKGSVTKQLITFVIPILFTYVLQHLYTIADRIVVGRFAENGEIALAAVGSTGSATTLIIGMFTGLATGTNVICANMRGARKQTELSLCMHSSLLLGGLTGVLLLILGLFLCEPILLLMGTPASVLDLAALYMRIYFLGVPFSLLYNYGAAILRAHGDTRRPMYILSISGLVNVALNLVLVIGFKRGVDGVAIATAVSHVLSCAAVLWILFSPNGEYKMKLSQIRFHKKSLMSVIRVGVPCGLNGMVFSVSNVIIQSAVNSFDSAIIIAGKTAASDIVAIVYQVIASFHLACVSFSGQCFGARQYRRIDNLMLRACTLCWIVMISVSTICTVFSRQMLGLFNSNPEVIEAGIGVLLINCWGYILFVITEVVLGCLRGMGKSGMPTLLNVIGICAPRILWVSLVFPFKRTMEFLYLCYPISWLISALMLTAYYIHCRKKLPDPVVATQ